MNRILKLILIGCALTIVCQTTACVKPEIAVVLEDYCDFQKSCDYAKVKNQYQSLKSCDKFHRDLLDNASDGSAKGCKGDVEDFFIDFMNAQMAQPGTCSEDLMDSLNRDTATQNQLKSMMMCVKEKGSGDVTAALNMSAYIISELELDLHKMKPEVCKTLLGTFMADKTEMLNTVCNEAILTNMTPELCETSLGLAKTSGKIDFTDEQTKLLCDLFKTYE